MVFKELKRGVVLEDEDFNAIYPEYLQDTAFTHFTPVEIAIDAAKYLTEKPGTRVLDIGSGAGKFCMIGSVCTEGHFTGVEQREKLHLTAERLRKEYELPRLKFLHANINQVDFGDYDAFYFFNAFYENILQFERIDTSVKVEKELYAEHSNYVRDQLATKPVGTRLVTYFSSYDEVPESFALQYSDDRIKLTLWEKMT